VAQNSSDRAGRTPPRVPRLAGFSFSPRHGTVSGVIPSAAPARLLTRHGAGNPAAFAHCVAGFSFCGNRDRRQALPKWPRQSILSKGPEALPRAATPWRGFPLRQQPEHAAAGTRFLGGPMTADNIRAGNPEQRIRPFALAGFPLAHAIPGLG
jgi:hypothetical protein